MKRLLLLAALVSLSLPMSAQAALVSQEVVLGPYNVSTATPTLDPVNVIPGTPMELRVLNPTMNDLTFSSPDLGINMVVPANAERRISVEGARTANLGPGQQVAFYILDPNGNQIASSEFVSTDVAYNFEQVTVTQTTAVNEEAPSSTAPTERSSTVRGYW